MASEQRAPAAGGELRMRVISAAILGPVALAAVMLGGWAFAALMAAMAALAIGEWAAITNAREPAWPRLAAALSLVAGIAALQAAFFGIGLALIALPAALAALGGLHLRTLGWIGAGLVYVGGPSAALVLLRQPEQVGLLAILFVLFVVWATDIGAYFGGRGIGGPKLWPRVSPKKTWSGALSGLVAALVAGGATAGIGGIGVRTGLALAVPLSVAAQAGDLFESAVKRRFGVKDSGTIIPGHGGVLDRVDGLFGAAALALVLALVGLGGDILALPDLGTDAGRAP